MTHSSNNQPEGPFGSAALVNRLRRAQRLWALVEAAAAVPAGVLRSVLPLVERTLNEEIRFLTVQTRHIGHLALEPDSYVKEEVLGGHPHYRAVMLAAPHGVCNPHLMSYFKRHFHIVSNTILAGFLRRAVRGTKWGFDMAPYAQLVDSTSTAPAINTAWGERAPVWKLTVEDQRRGREALEKLGVPPDRWFVCVHCRESGYSSDMSHSYRDVHVSNYIPAMEAIVERGGWCIRVGDRTMQPLPKLDRVVDYCHHEVRCDWLDVFLCASCRFFLGSGSGLQMVASIFGVPVAAANLAPMSSILGLRPGDLGIPKLVRSRCEQRFLTFGEVLGSRIAGFRFRRRFEEAGLDLVEDSPDDVKSLAMEMLDRLEDEVEYTPADAFLQSRIRSLVRPGHFMYGSEARVGRDFLRKYDDLLIGSQRVHPEHPRTGLGEISSAGIINSAVQST